jgi:hypothetical protein
MRLFKKQSAEVGRRARLTRDPLQKTTNFSYHSRRAEVPGNPVRQIRPDEQESLKPRRPQALKIQRFKVMAILIVVLLLAVGLLHLSNNPKIVVLSDTDQKPFLQNTTIYQRAAAKQFSVSILNANKITVDTGTISDKLLAEFPELSSVSVSVPLLSSQPTVYIQPAQPAIIFAASNGSYVLDTNGRALQPVTQFIGLASLHLPTVTNQSDFKVELGQQALTASDVTFIQTVIYELSARKITVSSFSIPAGTSELDATLEGEPYYVKFNFVSSDPRQQAGSFLAIQAQLSALHLTPSHYIDVRVDGRAYYQ